MSFKNSTVSGFGAVLALSLLAQAQTSAPRPLDKIGLARMEGTLAFCAKVDPQSAPKYTEKAKLLIKGQPEKVVEQVRKSKEYQDNLDLTNKQLETISSNDGIAACRAYLEEK